MNPNEMPLLGEPAPLELANSLYFDGAQVIDFLREPAVAKVWLEALSTDRVGPPPRRLGAQDLAAIRHLRDALHRIFTAAVEERSPAPRDVAALNRHLAAAHPHARLRWGAAGFHVEVHYRGPAGTTYRARLAAAAADVLMGPERERLRRCEGPGCALLFLKQHHKRRFCHPSCGQRGRQRRYYRRKHIEQPRAAR